MDNRFSPNTNVSQSAEVKPTFYRRQLDSGMHVLCRSSELELWRYAIRLPAGLAGRPCWVKGHCCLVPACQAGMAVGHRYPSGHNMQSAKQATRAGLLEEEGHLGRLRAWRKDRVNGEL